MPKIKILISFCCLLFFFPLIADAQQQWMVYFKDKQHNDFNPYAYFDAKAIERRIRTGVPVDDPTDWPVNEDYVKVVSPMVNDVLLTSRWFNAVAVDADQLQIMSVRQLPFVLDIEWLEPLQLEIAESVDYDTTLSSAQAEVLSGQMSTLGIDAWRKAGFNGKGLRIAIFDVGFDHADKVPAFDHIRSDKRLIATKDFTSRKKSDYVYYGNGHGTNVWSCIAGKIGDLQIGLATGAEFLLAKTEIAPEKFSEELNWLAAAEWADKNGADIINSSLGYTGKRYFNWQMDGKTSFVTRAANMAARKGILVVNAAGNDGNGKWHYIGAPADADSALSIGGINPATGYHTGFSSYGPTSDKRMKPNLVAYGHVVAASPGGLKSTQGTSFASPLMAGFAACAWQSNRELTNMQLFKELEKSGNLYPYFDYAHGYGLPQAGFFLEKDHTAASPTFRVVERDEEIVVLVNKPDSLMVGKPEASVESGKQVSNAINNAYLYYNLMNNKGVLDSYYVLEVSQEEVLKIPRNALKQGETLNVHYAGYSYSFKL